MILLSSSIFTRYREESYRQLAVLSITKADSDRRFLTTDKTGIRCVLNSRVCALSYGRLCNFLTCQLFVLFPLRGRHCLCLTCQLFVLFPVRVRHCLCLTCKLCVLFPMRGRPLQEPYMSVICPLPATCPHFPRFQPLLPTSGRPRGILLTNNQSSDYTTRYEQHIRDMVFNA